MAICKSRNGESGNGIRGMMECEESEWACGNQGGNEGNQCENLSIGVELMNYNCGEG